ncbi:Scramblase-domain-containing protein [Leucosporidium creatinivorum]|uniref:Scramblase-domain-containing protein n=1 Tax=Leucosporidium creatinivorum TaxID=106004 RepID=A0A1Y2G1H9_9BASI|nr:Scramblase-domain-containing protein [Leucosporidium creatinivorum]
MIVRHAAAATRCIVLQRPLTTSALQLASRHTRSRPPVRVTRRPPASTSPTELSAPPTAPEQPTREHLRTPALPLVSRLPVHVPHDSAGVLDSSQGPWVESLRTLLSVPALVVARQIEMMNILVGYEQANRYQLLSPEGEVLGYLLEEELGIGSAIKRQVLRTHRPFKATVLDKEGRVLLIIRRPFAWINSRIYVCTPLDSGSPTTSSSSTSTSVVPAEPLPPAQVQEDKVIGETQQIWHLYKRQYEHFVSREGEMVQFGKTDAGFLSWDFVVEDEHGKPVGSINRNFAGFARELFTDTGQYVVRFEGVADELAAGALPAPEAGAEGALPSPSSSSPSSPSSTTSTSPTSSPSSAASSPPTTTSSPPATSSSPPTTDLTIPTSLPSLGLDARAVLLATAITADIDYFSRHSGHGGGMGMGGMWMPIPMGGGAAPAEAGEAGAVGGGEVAGEAGAAGREVGPTGETEGGQVQDGGWSGNDGGGGGFGSWGGWGGSGSGEGSASATPASGQNQWGDEVMQDPWGSQEQGAQEEGGTWGWGDLFPDE